MLTENLFDNWSKRNPKFEIQFEEKLLRIYTDYGIGASDVMSSKGKILGAGYELYILAFFIGLYSNNRKVLNGDTKVFGQPIQYWGNLEAKKNRKAYPKLREYIFAALIAKTDELDLLSLEKGLITERKAIDYLIDTMEQYANYGFYKIEDKLKDNPNYLYKNTGFLDLILDLVHAPRVSIEEIEEL